MISLLVLSEISARAEFFYSLFSWRLYLSIHRLYKSQLLLSSHISWRAFSSRPRVESDLPRLGLVLLEVSFPKQRRNFCCVKVVGERVRSSSTLVSCETSNVRIVMELHLSGVHLKTQSIIQSNSRRTWPQSSEQFKKKPFPKAETYAHHVQYWSNLHSVTILTNLQYKKKVLLCLRYSSKWRTEVHSVTWNRWSAERKRSSWLSEAIPLRFALANPDQVACNKLRTPYFKMTWLLCQPRTEVPCQWQVDIRIWNSRHSTLIFNYDRK